MLLQSRTEDVVLLLAVHVVQILNGVVQLGACVREHFSINRVDHKHNATSATQHDRTKGAEL